MIVLNRTHFYASSRVPLSFDRLYLRFALYIVPLTLFLYQIQSVLRAVRCQTSPTWSEMQYGAVDRQMETDFAGEGGLLWYVASSVLFWETTAESCRAANMLPVDASLPRASGSLALLWPLFLTLGFGQFVDTLACALQGRRPIQEVGMTIFEHSLAFAEAEALTHFFKPKSVFTPDGTLLMMPKSKLSDMANVPPEVLLISLISSLSHFTSNLLAIFGVRSRYRLVTTTIWGLAYMSAFAWSFNRLTLMVADPDHHVGILRFPTVCIIGFIPHLLILVGISICGLIYLLALIITVLSPPIRQPATLKERFAAAYDNLHANIHLSSITPLTINWHEDFYTTILKVGYVILTAASEAVFLNEGTTVNVHAMTWLEKKRLQEILARRRKTREALCSIPSELKKNTFAPGIEAVDFTDISTGTSTSGYAKERKTRGVKAPTDPSSPMGQHDPALQQRSRYLQAYQFFRRISGLIVLSLARIVDWILTKVAISYRPRWLRRAAGGYAEEKPYTPASRSGQSHYPATTSTNRWLTTDDRSRVRQDQEFDVESFAKERLQQSGFYSEPDTEASEERLNDYLYSWWRNGGLWNDVDNSKDYVVSQDDDTTSVVSFATTTDNDEWSEWSDIDDGQRTPTRDTYQRSREETPSVDDAMDFSRLSQLLDPRTREDREEAKLLSRHLQSSRIMTRSQYREAVERDEARILTTSRYEIGGSDNMSPEEEEQLLEDLILSRRSATAPQGASNANSWGTGAEGMGSEGPQCVVCQMSPRTVLVWPCGCLSLCDDCRVGLASKNYTACVCCRTNVAAYSRLYVP